MDNFLTYARQGPMIKLSFANTICNRFENDDSFWAKNDFKLREKYYKL